MYLQITTRCNMTCEHCCFNCTHEGEDMTAETFENALEFIVDHDPYSIDIGGGEPTLHPLFKSFLMDCLGEAENVWLATNGSVKKTALLLCKMARNGVIGCALSRDPYHDYDMVDEEVMAAFQDGMVREYYGGPEAMRPDGHRRNEKDRREIRDTSHSIKGAGRALENELADKGCACGGICIKPNGDVASCPSCEGAVVFGNVNRGDVVFPEDYNWCGCHTESHNTRILEKEGLLV